MSAMDSHNNIYQDAEDLERSSGLLPVSTLYLFLSLYLLLLAFFIVLVSGMNFDEQRVSDALNSLEQSFSSSEEILSWRDRSDEVLGADINGQVAMFDRINMALGGYLAHTETVENAANGQLSVYLRSSEIFDENGQMTRSGIYGLDAFGDELIRSEINATLPESWVIKADIILYYEAGQEQKAIADVSQIVQRLEAIGTPSNRMTIAISPLSERQRGGDLGDGRGLSQLDNVQIQIGFENKNQRRIDMLSTEFASDANANRGWAR